MTEVEMIKWIDEADYTALLRKWRFGEMGDAWFVGEVGSHFADIMFARKEALSQDKQVQASKYVGWGK